MKHRLPAILLSIVAVACSRPSPVKQSASGVSESDFTEDAVCWADSMLSEMTVEQCIGQLLMPAVYANSDTATIKLIESYTADIHAGGLLLLKGDRHSASEISKRMSASSTTGCWIAIDAEWGLSMRLADMPSFPAQGEISLHADEQIMYDYGREVGHEARATGINMILGPVVDVAPNDRPGILGRRTLGADPHRVASLATAYALGAESAGVITVAKHFPGHGQTRVDSHNSVSTLQKDYNELYDTELLPFRYYIDNNLSAIMVGHIVLPKIDRSGRPATSSRQIMHTLLRDSLGFKGLILTDALNMKGASGSDALDALLAGADIIIAPTDTRTEFHRLMQAVTDGRFPLSLLHEKCRRILFHKYKTNILANHRPTAPEVIVPDNALRIARQLRDAK